MDNWMEGVYDTIEKWLDSWTSGALHVQTKATIYALSGAGTEEEFYAPVVG